MRSGCQQGDRGRRSPRRLALALLVMLLAATAPARPTVVVSIHPLFDLARQVAGERAEVVRVLPPGASEHTFDPTPRDVARVVGADLVIMNGGLDLWLRDLVEASGSRAPIVELIADPELQEVLRESFPGLVAADAHGTVLGFNPHAWLDPIATIPSVHRIAEALAGVDPDGAPTYRANAEALHDDLLALDARLRGILAPVVGAPFVPFHDAWPYFAARYGLDLVVEIEPFPGREPSPAYLRMALGLIRDSGARVVFGEVQLSRRPAEVVAAEAGVALGELDPLGGFPGRERYQDLLVWNATAIADALLAAATR